MSIIKLHITSFFIPHDATSENETAPNDKRQENDRFENRWWVYYEVVMIDESLIDAVYKLLCWAIEQGYVETNKNE